MSTVSLAGGWQLNDTWSLRGGIGLILSGDLHPQMASKQMVQSGGMIALGVENLYHRGSGRIPTLDYSFFISASVAETEHPVSRESISYASSDMRIGARATWNVKDQVFPFVATRVFGGPVNWELNGVQVTGSDVHHYQIALGAAIQFSSIGTFVEWAGLGEKALSVGFSVVL